MVNQAIIQKAGSIMQRYGPENPPDPAYLFRLNNVIQPGANVFAFQKVGVGADVSGGGPWGFDVFFEKLDGSTVNWDCECAAVRSYMDRHPELDLTATCSLPSNHARRHALSSLCCQVGGV
jgi:hypothetical protein